MERLIPMNEKLHGWELKFPDTVFYAKGKAKFLIKTDKDGHLTANRNSTKLTIHQIRNDFTAIVIKRKRADDILRQSKNFGGASMFQNIRKGNFNIIKLIDGLGTPQDDDNVESSLFYRDIALIRFTNEQIEVLKV